MKILILDDADVRHKVFDLRYEDHDVHHAMTYREFISQLEAGSPWDLIHLDHDLGDYTTGDTFVDSWGQTREYNGQHAAYKICELSDDMLPKQVIIQSINPEGAKRIKQILQKRGVLVAWTPFGVISEKEKEYFEKGSEK